MNIKINLDPSFEKGEYYFGCPLRTDRNACGANYDISINGCPKSYEDEDGNCSSKAPENCPLRNGQVIIERKET